MNGALNAALTVIAGIITVAIVSVLVSKKSVAPAAISASGGFLATVINAAVNPIAASNATMNGASSAAAFASPAQSAQSLTSAVSTVTSLASMFGA